MNLKDYEKTNGYQSLIVLSEGNDFLNKLDVDTELSETEKTSFMDYLSRYNESLHGEIKTYCCKYFQSGKKFLSTNSYTDSKNHPFVRIKDVVRFSGWIREIVTDDVDDTIKLLSDDFVPISIKEIVFKALISTEIRDEILNDPKRAMYYLGSAVLSLHDSPTLESAKTDPWMVWSFPFPDSEIDLFSPGKLPNLDCRAGLSENKDLDKVVYTHNVSSCSYLRKPTVFDAEFYMQFAIGGRTKPLIECEDEDGFDEYVHDPNKFKDIIETPKFIKK